jgi:endonuclease YncB( thermonuclease family)
VFRFFISLFFYRQKSYRRIAYTYKAPPRTVSQAYKNQALPEAVLREKINTLPKARVLWVVDGDTAIVSDGWNETTIRLDSIDTPEDGQEWGDIAKFGLIKLVGNKNVRLEEHGKDSYGRTLATLYVWNDSKLEWMNVNERMVILGHAWVMRKFYDHLPPDRQDKLNRLEKWARSKSLGLWRTPNPTPPWLWRRQ